MKRISSIASLAVALAGIGLATAAQADTLPAASAHHRRHPHAAARRHAALAPIAAPKAATPPVSAQSAAPVPNESVSAPPDRSGQETSVAPSVMQLHYPPIGDGYTLGSSAQAMDDREAAKVTGVQMKVPLGQ